MVDIVATPGATNANSYCTLAEAETYFTTRLHADTWTSASTGNKEIALVMATRVLDSNIDWHGTKSDDDQALRWPQYGQNDRDGYSIDNNVVPQDVKNATAEMAMYLLAGDRTAEPDTLGFDQIKVGPIMLDIDKADRDAYGVIPDSVQNMISHLGGIQSRNPTVAQLARA